MKSKLQAGAALANLGATLVRVMSRVGLDIFAALPGGISPDEADAIGKKVLDGEDIKLMVRGEDIIDDEAQAALATFVGRVASRLGSALTGGDDE